jgi:hypothetical protein
VERLSIPVIEPNVGHDFVCQIGHGMEHAAADAVIQIRS